jgi:crotonobetainyl-CoA:carnitine CoA-transferase CaiB-like acyl-CoA transferase
MGGWQAEYMAGLQGFQATLVALLWRGEGGPGQHVDLSIMDVIAGNLEGATTEYPYVGMIRRRKANRFVYGHPNGVYKCKDGYINVLPGLGGMQMLALLLEQPELEEEPLFKDRYLRQERWQEFDERFINPYFKDRERSDIYDRAQELRMPFGLISTTDELQDDRQLKHREYFVDIEHPVAGKLAYPGAPFKMSETPWQAERAPLLGEHNEEVYGQRLGYSKDDLVKLRERNII